MENAREQKPHIDFRFSIMTFKSPFRFNYNYCYARSTVIIHCNHVKLLILNNNNIMCTFICLKIKIISNIGTLVCELRKSLLIGERNNMMLYIITYYNVYNMFKLFYLN